MGILVRGTHVVGGTIWVANGLVKYVRTC